MLTDKSSRNEKVKNSPPSLPGQTQPCQRLEYLLRNQEENAPVEWAWPKICENNSIVQASRLEK